MTTQASRLDRLERRLRPPRQAVTFVPVGVAHTEAEEGWLTVERERLGLREGDELLAFAWGKETNA